MVTVTLIGNYPPSGIQSICQPQDFCGPSCYEPCGYGVGHLSGYGPSGYEPRGYSYIYGSDTSCFVPHHYGYFSGTSCYSPCHSGYYGYGGSCYDPCDYGHLPICRQPRYASRRRYSCRPISCNPCYYGGRPLVSSRCQGYTTQVYNSCGPC